MITSEEHRQNYEMEQERRHDYSELTSKIGHLEMQMAVIDERTENTKALKKWILSQFIVVAIAVIGIAVSWGDLHARLEAISINELEQNMVTVLTVIGDHGTEIQGVRDEQLRIRENHDEFEARVHKELQARTDDRFRRRDFDAIFNPHVELDQMRFRRLEEKINAIKADTDYYFHGKNK